MNKKPIVVFDLDGTLVDSAPDLLDSLNYCLGTGGLKPVSRADLRQLIGQGGRVMIERALTSQNIFPEPQHVDRLIDIFLQHYSKNIPGKTGYFDGVTNALDALQQAGYMLAVCTNKYEHLAKLLLKALDKPDRYVTICGGDTFEWRKPDPQHILSTVAKAGGDISQAVDKPDRYVTICGGDTFEWRKPDPQHILSTVAKAGGDISQAVMAGDSGADINAAKAAGIPVIAVDFGYADIPVTELDPAIVISSFSKLTPQVIGNLLKQAHT